RRIVEVRALALHQALRRVVRAALEDHLGDSGGAAGRILVLEAGGADRAPLHGVTRHGVVRCRGRPAVDAQRVCRRPGRDAELRLRRRLSVDPFPDQLVVRVGDVVLQYQERLLRRLAARGGSRGVRAAAERVAGIVRARVAVVAVEWCAVLARPGSVTHLNAVADVAVGRAGHPHALELARRRAAIAVRQVAVVALLARLNLPIATAGVEHGDRDGIDGKQWGAVPGTVQVYPEYETEIGGVDVRGSAGLAPQVTRVAEQQEVAVTGDMRASVGLRGG